MSSRTDRTRRPNFGYTPRHTAASLAKCSNSTASRELKDVLERKIEDLSRQLAESRQACRQTKTSEARLQREINRIKAHDQKTGKEQLSKELEQQKMMRVEAERRLHEMTKESENCRSRLEKLQGEFRKMENLVTDMMQYKSKIDQLKHEKSSLSVTYENNIYKFKGHITDLERENMVLLNEVKKFETQINNKSDDRDRSKLLLERLRMLEGENSSLVLENEQQRGQYEKCLDEIANQVVQALLAQKMLREECLKLQNRVRDLEVHNRQLCVVFHQRIKMATESTEQTGSLEGSPHGVYIEGSIESLQSMFSEQMSENLPSMPQMSSPPPWLRDRLPGDRHSLISFTGRSTPDLDFESQQQKDFNCRMEIETEFPATPSSPRSKHVSVFERKKEKRSSSVSSLTSNRGPSKQRTQSTSSLSRARGFSFLQPHATSHSHESGIQNATTSPELISANQGNSEHSREQSVSPSRSKSSKAMSNQSLDKAVPFNQSNPSISSQLTQGHTPRQMSKIPVFPTNSKGKEDVQLRRNSLKAEYGIRMGCQSPTVKASPNVSSNLKQPQSRSVSQGSQGSKSVSMTMGNQSHSKSPSNSTNQGHSRPSGKHGSSNSRSTSVTSNQGQSSSSGTTGRSQSAGSRIPTVSRLAGLQTATKSSSKENISPQHKVKTSTDKQPQNTATKLVPPKSPVTRYSGIRTTLKGDLTNRTMPVNSNSNRSDGSSVNQKRLSSPASVNNASMRSTYSLSPSGLRRNVKVAEGTKPPLPAKGERTPGHYPIMGLTNLNHTSPKSEDSQKIYANIVNMPSTFTTVPPRSETDCSNSSNGDCIDGPIRNQYFYDYSDEDSDFNRPVSKDFSIASTVSLDELLDQTLENIETPMDGEYSSDYFLFNSQHTLLQQNNNAMPLFTPADFTVDANRESAAGIDNKSETNVRESPNKERENRLQGKPDIVQDTEHSEQKNLQKSLTISQIPGSSIPGYRARRPKSLILGAKDKKFLYCEYGSSSSSDSSDGEWSYHFSYAKNIKQQEIQSKIAKSLKSGQATAVETPNLGNVKEIKVRKSQDDVCNIQQTTQTDTPAGGKKSKVPPPVAAKPMRRKSTPSGKDGINVRPKSMEICVNTVMSSNNPKTCYSYLDKVNLSSKEISKCESDKCLNMSGNLSMKLEHSDTTFNSTFDEVKVERSGSKDDGYSTMSSDVQPEILEKYSDVLESSTNSNDVRNSNLSLSSQNSFSSEDRSSIHGSMGRVRAMKLKFEMESHRSPERESSTSPKSPPVSPARSLLKSPKHIPEKYGGKGVKPVVECVNNKDKPGNQSGTKIPKPKSVSSATKEPVSKVKSAIPLPKSVSAKKDAGGIVKASKDKANSTDIESANKELKQFKSKCVEQTVNENKQVKMSKDEKPDYLSNYQYDNLADLPLQYRQMLPHTSTPSKSVVDQFAQLATFTPTVDHIAFLRDGSYDSNSSLSDRGSDLTSLHISEDYILSDIPEERDGYESSVGRRSENTSVSSLHAITPVKKPQPSQTQQHSHSQHHHHHQPHTTKYQFRTTLRRYWSSYQGLVRAKSISDFERQKHAKETADYEELYGGCLNIECLMERSSSESDIYSRGDKPEVNMLPGLRRRTWSGGLTVDEIYVEEQVQLILKDNMKQQISKNVASADKDDLNFNSFVAQLVQKGHVMEVRPPFQDGRVAQGEALPSLNQMTVSTFSSKGNNSSKGVNSGGDHFVPEERKDAANQESPVGEGQKRFNSQFYSLCNPGSNRSISEKNDSNNADQNISEPANNDSHKKVHRCDKGSAQCGKCTEERNNTEFDEISKQIENLSKTVNELHRSLNSLNSENSDSGSESNEGDSVLTSAIGNKDIDGYQWVEDEFFLSPYGGEITLGDSPFSNTGASCDWMNEYSESTGNFDEFGGSEALTHEEEAITEEFSKDFPVTSTSVSKCKIKPPQNSILAKSIDKEGNFDSQHFITQRLVQEEQRRKSLKLNNEDNSFELTTNFQVDPLQHLKQLRASLSPNGAGVSSRRLLKEDLRTTPEKDLDEADLLPGKAGTLEEMAIHGSQDSLDDNIGVDNVMCHRLIGGKGHNSAVHNTRPPLDFSNKQFTRYSDLEKQAVAAFDFLNEMSSSINSDQSNEPKISRGQLFLGEERRDVNAYRNQMNQSTTSNESRASPVKRSRRKLRPKVRKEAKEGLGPGYQRGLMFSSTSGDSCARDSAEDESFSDSSSGSYSSAAEDCVSPSQNPAARRTTMTYL